jgi:hypothetical protein
VGGLDPATTGKTAMIVAALDKVTGKRIVLDGFNKANCPPHLMREKIKQFTTPVQDREWVIERNAFQRYLTQDESLSVAVRCRAAFCGSTGPGPTSTTRTSAS